MNGLGEDAWWLNAITGFMIHLDHEVSKRADKEVYMK